MQRDGNDILMGIGTEAGYKGSFTADRLARGVPFGEEQRAKLSGRWPADHVRSRGASAWAVPSSIEHTLAFQVHLESTRSCDCLTVARSAKALEGASEGSR